MFVVFRCTTRLLQSQGGRRKFSHFWDDAAQRFCRVAVRFDFLWKHAQYFSRYCSFSLIFFLLCIRKRRERKLSHGAMYLLLLLLLFALSTITHFPNFFHAKLFSPFSPNLSFSHIPILFAIFPPLPLLRLTPWGEEIRGNFFPSFLRKPVSGRVSAENFPFLLDTRDKFPKMGTKKVSKHFPRE